jgi:hypothetical protein
MEENIKVGRKALGWSVMDWIYLSGDSDEWLAIMNARMKLRFQKVRGISGVT